MAGKGGADAYVSKFTLDYEGVGEVLRSPEMQREMASRAERVLAAAKAGAPVATGEYQAGLHMEQVVTDRAVARVAGGTDHDFIVEANTGNLARSLDQARG